MRQLLFSGISLLFILNAYAQEKQSAQDILAQVSRRYQQDESLKARFSFTAEQQGKPAGPAQQGSLLLKDARYRVELSDRTFISDGINQWTILKEVNEVQLTEVDHSGQTLSPTNIFTFYKNGYLTELLGSERAAGHQLYKIQLKPVGEEQQLKYITMRVRKDNYRIYDVQLLEENGNKMHYTIEQQQANVSLDSKAFVFQPSEYPDMEVVDLR